MQKEQKLLTGYLGPGNKVRKLIKLIMITKPTLAHPYMHSIIFYFYGIDILNGVYSEQFRKISYC